MVIFEESTAKSLAFAHRFVKIKFKNKNPSRRTFQALRIAVNHELDALEEGMDTILSIWHRADASASSPSTPLRTGW